jgi:glutamyl/glutaminyl-tRNA synthetase
MVALEIKKILPEADESEVSRIAPLVLERIDTLGDIAELMRSGEFSYIFETPEYDPSFLNWKDEPDSSKTKAHLTTALSFFKNESDFKAANLKALLWPYAEEQGKGNVLWPIRYALSGKAKSPDPFVLAELIGKEKTLGRIESAISKLS